MSILRAGNIVRLQGYTINTPRPTAAVVRRALAIRETSIGRCWAYDKPTAVAVRPVGSEGQSHVEVAAAVHSPPNRAPAPPARHSHPGATRTRRWCSRSSARERACQNRQDRLHDVSFLGEVLDVALWRRRSCLKVGPDLPRDLRRHLRGWLSCLCSPPRYTTTGGAVRDRRAGGAAAARAGWRRAMPVTLTEARFRTIQRYARSMPGPACMRFGVPRHWFERAIVVRCRRCSRRQDVRGSSWIWLDRPRSQHGVWGAPKRRFVTAETAVRCSSTAETAVRVAASETAVRQ